MLAFNTCWLQEEKGDGISDVMSQTSHSICVFIVKAKVIGGKWKQTRPSNCISLCIVLTEKSGILFTPENSTNTTLHQYFSIKIGSNTNWNVSEKKNQKEKEVQKRKAVIAKTNIINQNLNLTL